MMRTADSSLTSIAILGMGRSGRAVLNKAMALKMAAVWHDDGEVHNVPEQMPLLPQDWPWAELDAVVISPGISHEFPVPHPAAVLAKNHDVPVISEIEFALRTGTQGRWVVVTGTNGKSTTVALTGHILCSAGLKATVCGNIGTPVTGLPVQDEADICVVELSSYQLETTTSLSAEIRVILNITPDHLDRHDGWDGYVRAKAAILACANPNQLAILGPGPELDHIAGKHQDKITIRRLDEVSLSNETRHKAQDRNPTLQGVHNRQNCAAARMICHQFGLSDKQINDGITSFEGLPHRLQPTGQYKNIRFINDSKATNGEAAAKALASFDHIHWCAGGLAKEDGIAACLPYLSHVRQGYFYGRCANEFVRAVQGRVKTSQYETLEEAVEAAVLSADQKPDDYQVILLSPAAASFDQFTSFEARGEAFCQIAQQQLVKFKAAEGSTTLDEVRHA